MMKYAKKAAALLTAAVVFGSSFSADAADFSELLTSSASHFTVRSDYGKPSSQFEEVQNYQVLSYVGGSIADLPAGVVNYCFHRDQLFAIQYLRSFTSEEKDQAKTEYQALVQKLNQEFGKAQSNVETDILQNFWDTGDALVFTRMSGENGLLVIRAELGSSVSLEEAANYSGTLLLLPALKSGSAQLTQEGAVYYAEAPAEDETAAETPELEDGTLPDQTPSGIAVTTQNTVYTAASNLNLREDASTTAKIITTVKKGAFLTSTGLCANNWIRVDYNGTTCYASGDFVTPAVSGS